jgi:hypothetical protein
MELIIIAAIILVGTTITLALMFASIARIRYEDAMEYLEEDEL